MSRTPSLYPLRSGRAVNLWHYYWPEQDIRWQRDDHDNNNICVVRPLTTPQQRIVCIEYVHIVVAIVILSSLVWFSLVGRATSRKSTAIMRWGVLRQTWIHLLYTRIGELWHLLWHRQDDDATLIVRLTPSPLHCVGTLSGIIICDVRGHKQWAPNEELTYALPYPWATAEWDIPQSNVDISTISTMESDHLINSSSRGSRGSRTRTVLRSEWNLITV